MSVSYPSAPVVSADVPEVKRFEGEFVYKFFTTDEKINEDGSVPPSISKRTSVTFDTTYIDRIEKISPRFVRLSFSKVHIAGRSVLEKPTQPGLIRQNLEKIYSEEEFSGVAFSTVQFQDTGIDGKLFLLMSGTISKRINADNLKFSNEVNRELENIGSYIDSEKASLLDVSKLLNFKTEDEIQDKTIIKSLNRLEALGARFVDDDGIKEKIEDSFESIKSVKTRVRFNNKFIRTSIMSSINDSLGIFADELRPLLPTLDTIQTENVNRRLPTSMDGNEFDVVVEPIRQRIIPRNTFHWPNRRIVGYIIDKFIRLNDGTLEPRAPIVIETQEVSNAIDFKVAYDETYVYQIRAIAEISFQTFDANNDDAILSTILVSSQPSSRIVIDCQENIAPLAPADFNIEWDFSSKSARLTWSLPLNRQQDIKRFQVFRRDNINEPFELLREFDFDDSELRTPGEEQPSLNLIEQVSGPVGLFLDKEFNKNSDFIYTLCSIDAHGLSSNYCMQFQVSFDKFKNNIVKKLISNSGAPKSYPNLLLNSDAFVDVIRDSGHSKLKIFFDPEYLSVFGTKGNRDLNLLSTDQTNGSYKLSLVNVDLQKSERVDIILEDKRSTESKDQSPNYTRFNKGRDYR